MPRLATISGTRIWCAERPGGLRGHDFAMLVEADEGDERAERDREGEEALNQDAGCAGRHNARRSESPLPGAGQDLAGIRRESRVIRTRIRAIGAARLRGDEQPRHVEGERA